MYKNKKFFTRVIYVLPFILLFVVMYFMIFSESMDTAADRMEYIKIMKYPFSGREEIGIKLYSYISGFFISNPLYQLFIFQALGLSLIFFTFIINSKNQILLKILFVIFVSLFLFGVQFGVQLRIGFATSLLIFISLGLKKKPTIYNILWYVLPCLFHLAIVPFVISLYLFYYLNVREVYKLYKFYVIIFFIILGFSASLEYVITSLGLNAYYLDYLLEDPDYESRKFPFSLMLYFLILIIIYYKRNKFLIDYNFAVIPIGVIFSSVAIIMDFPFFHKFMSVFFFFSIMYLILEVSVSRKSENILITLLYLVMPFGFLYFSKTVFLI